MTIDRSTIVLKFSYEQNTLLQVYHLYSFGPKQMFFGEKKWQVAYLGPKCIYKTGLNKIQTCLNKVHNVAMFITNNKI